LGISNDNNEFIIPLRFFCNNVQGNCAPLIALQYHELKINVKLNEFANCILDVTQLQLNPPIQMSLDVNYYYLDTDERRKFAQISHEYLIRQIQFTGAERIDNQQNCQIRLNFHHPGEIVIWTLHTNDDDDLFCGFNGDPYKDALISASFMFNNHERSNHDAYHYRVIDKHRCGMKIPKVPIYTFSFACKPDMKKIQPTGTCNFSKLNNVQLRLHMKPGVKYVRVWLVSRNVLRVMSGMAGLAYSM